VRHGTPHIPPCYVKLYFCRRRHQDGPEHFRLEFETISKWCVLRIVDALDHVPHLRHRRILPLHVLPSSTAEKPHPYHRIAPYIILGNRHCEPMAMGYSWLPSMLAGSPSRGYRNHLPPWLFEPVLIFCVAAAVVKIDIFLRIGDLSVRARRCRKQGGSKTDEEGPRPSLAYCQEVYTT
jgi:hypothetical protein